jgi:hypothetical protein
VINCYGKTEKPELVGLLAKNDPAFLGAERPQNPSLKPFFPASQGASSDSRTNKIATVAFEGDFDWLPMLT